MRDYISGYYIYYYAGRRLSQPAFRKLPEIGTEELSANVWAYKLSQLKARRLKLHWWNYWYYRVKTTWIVSNLVRGQKF